MRRIDAVGQATVLVALSTLVPCAILTALARWATWPPHWLEPILLAGLPGCMAMCVGIYSRSSTRWYWASLILLTAAVWYLVSPHIGADGRLTGGRPFRGLIADINLLLYGGVSWTSYRVAEFGASAAAAVAATSVATYYAMMGLEWVGARFAAVRPAKPVTKLSAAAWARRSEVQSRFGCTGGIVLGELTPPRRGRTFIPDDPVSWKGQGKGPLITLDPKHGNAHSLIFSGSGSYKTAGIAIPNALTYAGPLVVVDPKGEIHQVAGPVREARGRRSWQISAADGFDPVKLLTALEPNDGTVFTDLAEFMMAPGSDDRPDAAAFFQQKSRRCLAAILGHLHLSGPQDNIFVAANRFLSLPPVDLRIMCHDSAIHYRDNDNPDLDYISVGLDELAGTEERQLSSVVATIANALAWTGTGRTRGFLASESDSDKLLARLRDPLTDIYVQVPTTVFHSSPAIGRVLIGALVRAFRAMALATPSEPPKHRLIVIDEARALRRMDYLAAVRDEGRAYGIHLMQIFQSWQQLVECYGVDGAGAWANSVDAMVLGPVADHGQAQALSTMIGRRTVTTSSATRQRTSQLFQPFSSSAGSSESTQLRETELIRPSELRQLPAETAIILATGTPPILASKAIWFTRRDMQTLVSAATAQSGSTTPAPEPVGPVNPTPALADGATCDPQPNSMHDPIDLATAEGWLSGMDPATGTGDAGIDATTADPDYPSSSLITETEAEDPELWPAAHGWTSAPVEDAPEEIDECEADISAESPPPPPAFAPEVVTPDHCADGQTSESVHTAKEEFVESNAEVGTGTPISHDLQAAIEDRTRYGVLIERAVELDICAVAETVLSNPSLQSLLSETSPQAIPPYGLGRGFADHDHWSIVFLPRAAGGPIHRVVFNKSGTLIGPVTMYCVNG